MNENDSTAKTGDETCLACTLHGREFAERKDAIARELFANATEVKELADGVAAYRFEGFNSWAQRILAFIAVEKECCPFFTFELALEPNDGPVWLRLRGSAEVKQLVTSPSSTGSHLISRCVHDDADSDQSNRRANQVIAIRSNPIDPPSRR